jgi:hypothetical protein
MLPVLYQLLYTIADQHVQTCKMAHGVSSVVNITEKMVAEM